MKVKSPQNEKIFAKHNCLVSKIYKELLQINNKINEPSVKWEKDVNIVFSKEM